MDARMTNADWALLAAVVILVVFCVAALVWLTRGWNKRKVKR